MHELTTAEKEAYVRRVWENVIVCDGSYRSYARGTVLFNWANHKFYEFADWDAAYAFTLAREEEVRQVEEEVALLKGWRYVQEGISPQATRILAREQAALDELKRGMRGDSKC